MRVSYYKYNVAKGLRRVKSKTALVLSGAALGITGLCASLVMPLAAHADVSTNYEVFGDASVVASGNPGNAVQATTTGANAYGGVDFKVPSGVTTVSSLSTLSTDYKFTTGDCGLGSPRFVAEVTTPTNETKNIFFYLGPAPNYTGCTPNTWLNTGNLAAGANLVDATQLGGGFYQSFADVQAAYGAYPVTDVYLVVDGVTQTVLFDNSQVNTTSFTFEAPTTTPSKDSCKNNGWKAMTDATGKKFKNQGDCVSYFATNGKNTASGPKKNTSVALGDVTLSNPTQTLSFSAKDNGTSAVDQGVVTYSNPGVGLTYTTSLTCVNISGHTAYFTYQIPSNAPVAANTWVIWKVVDNGATDTAGFTTATDMTSANAVCDAGNSSVTNYAITTGTIVVKD